MSLTYTQPECTYCHLHDTSRIHGSSKRFTCNSCGRSFEPIEPEEKELKLAIELNSRKRAYHVYVGEEAGYTHQKQELIEEIDKLHAKLTKLEFNYLMSEQVIAECDKNEVDLRAQLAILVKRRRDREAELSKKRSGSSDKPASPAKSSRLPKISDDAVKMMQEMMERAVLNKELSEN